MIGRLFHELLFESFAVQVLMKSSFEQVNGNRDQPKEFARSLFGSAPMYHAWTCLLLQTKVRELLAYGCNLCFWHLLVC